MLRIITFLTVYLLLVGSVLATTYTVKTSGGDYATIQACSDIAVAGDICDVYSGTYAGWTQNTDGSSGSLITFQAHTGDTVNISSKATITGRSYIRITGFNFTGAVASGSEGQVTANQASHCRVDHNNFNSQPVMIGSSGNAGADNQIDNNTVAYSSSASNYRFNVYGDRNLVENNTVSGGGGDCFDIGGDQVVVRNNVCSNQNATTTGEHIDFVQVIGGYEPVLTNSLIEGNVETNCTDGSNNCHFAMIRSLSTQSASDGIIVRYNYAYNLDGSGCGFGGSSTDKVSNVRFYNNTMATENPSAANGNCAGENSVSPEYFKTFNNICYNTTVGGWSITSGTITAGNADIAFTTGYSGTWGAPYSAEATYATLRNQNPSFANYPADGTLQVGSPAIDAGVALTTVDNSDTGSGTSLIVADARFFQPGWAGSDADWIAVGSTANTVQISSINYATNTITLAGGVTREDGDSVWLYKKSDGVQVLYNTTSDVGAYEHNPAVVVNGSCGTSDGVVFAVAPTTNLCATGTESAVTGSKTAGFAWTCGGSGGGTTDSCITAEYFRFPGMRASGVRWQ